MQTIGNIVDTAGSALISQSDSATDKPDKGSDATSLLWQAIFAAMGLSADVGPATDTVQQQATPEATDVPAVGASDSDAKKPATSDAQLPPQSLLQVVGAMMAAQAQPQAISSDKTQPATPLPAAGPVVAAVADVTRPLLRGRAAPDIQPVIDLPAAPTSAPKADSTSRYHAQDIQPLVSIPPDSTASANANAEAVDPSGNASTVAQAQPPVSVPDAALTATATSDLKSQDSSAPVLPPLAAAEPVIVPEYASPSPSAPPANVEVFSAHSQPLPSGVENLRDQVQSPLPTLPKSGDAIDSQAPSQQKVNNATSDAMQSVQQLPIAAGQVQAAAQSSGPAATAAKTSSRNSLIELPPHARFNASAADAEQADAIGVAPVATVTPVATVARTSDSERTSQTGDALIAPGVEGAGANALAGATGTTQTHSIQNATQQAHSIGQQVVQAFTSRPAQAGNLVSIRLDPPDMGSVKLTLKTDRGEVRGVVEVDNPRTLADLKGETPSLLSRLADSGIQVRSMEFVLNHHGGGDASAYMNFGDRSSGQQSQSQGGQYLANEPVEVQAQATVDAPAGVVGADAINIWV